MSKVIKKIIRITLLKRIIAISRNWIANCINAIQSSMCNAVLHTYLSYIFYID